MTEQPVTDQYEGIVNPPIDTLLDKVDSKYALVLFAAKRARQINAYYAQLHEGLFEYVGPLVDTKLNEKALSISLREVDEGLLEVSPESEEPVTVDGVGSVGSVGSMGSMNSDDFSGFDLAAGQGDVEFSDEGFLQDEPVADATSDPGTATDPDPVDDPSIPNVPNTATDPGGAEDQITEAVEESEGESPEEREDASDDVEQ